MLWANVEYERMIGKSLDQVIGYASRELTGRSLPCDCRPRHPRTWCPRTLLYDRLAHRRHDRKASRQHSVCDVRTTVASLGVEYALVAASEKLLSKRTADFRDIIPYADIEELRSWDFTRRCFARI
jgi:hypothetical protein